MLVVGMLVGAAVGCGDGDQADAQVRLLKLGDFDTPTYITAPKGDRRRFVVQRAGKIVVVKGRKQLATPFLDISGQVSLEGEEGLLSMAFAPDYKRSGRFYIYYTDRQGFIQIDQYRRSAGNPNRADPASRRSVLRVPHFRTNHKGGQLQFGKDGYLYAGFGDGGAAGDPDENAQDLGRMLGKLIRIAPRAGGGYSIPKSNPFVHRRGALHEIYAYGLRNPFRFSFDLKRGHLVIGDVGQDAVEEVDFIPGRKGGLPPRGGYNFGWDVFEGRSPFEAGSAPGRIWPVITHTHDSGWCSVIGGYVIRDPSLRGTRWYGRYVHGDLCSSELRLAHLARPRAADRGTGLHVSQLDSFGEDGRGRVYAVSIEGPIYRIGRG
jgi:hypothetical protein